jgi:Tfp pilus assembly protein PilF
MTPGNDSVRTGSATARFPMAALILAAASLAVYLGVYDAPYVLDDAMTINEAAGEVLPDLLRAHPTRALSYLSFALVEALGGGLALHHAMNVALHMVNSLLVFSLLGMARRLRAPDLPRGAPLLGALLWAVHPLHTGAVTYITQRITDLAAATYLGAVLCYLHAREMRANGASFGSRAHLSWYLSAVLMATLAAFTKENTATLPAAMVLCEWLLVGRRAPESGLARAVLLAPLLVTLVIPLTSPPSLESWQGRPAPKIVAGSAPPEALHGVYVDQDFLFSEQPTRKQYLLSQPGVLLRYLRLWVLPMNQVFNPHVDLPRTAFQAIVIVPTALMIGLAGFGLLQIRRQPLVTFGILWFFVAISVESSVVPLPDLMFEHRMLLPSVGLMVALTAMGGGLLARWPRAAVVLPIAIGLALGACTIARNRVWASPITFWSDNVEKSPKKLRGWLSLAGAYELAGRQDLAEETLLRAREIFGDAARLHFWLGSLQMRGGALDAAEISFRRALKLDPSYGQARYNLGTILAQTGRHAAAEATFRRVILLHKAYRPEAHYNLGLLFLREGRALAAARQLEAAVAGRPDLAPAHYELAVAYQKLGRLEDARREAAIAARLKNERIVR